jgi:hypothetical protein
MIDDDMIDAGLEMLKARHSKPNGNGAPPQEHKYRLIRFDDLRPDPSASRYLVDGVIPSAGLVAIWGPPKCGKSFFVFNLVMHIALGWEYRGRRRVQSGPVVYLAFEGAAGFGARAEAFRRKAEHPIPDKVQFFLLASNAKLVRDHQSLIKAIDAQINVPPVCVVIDTLNRSIDGSESKDQDMGAYLSAADAIVEEFGCVVIIVHHCGIDGNRPRGHTSLTGAVDAQLAVKRDAANNVVVEVEWMKDGEEGAKIASRLEVVDVGTDTYGAPITSCAILPADDVPADKTAKPTRMPANAKTALKALKDAIDECGEAAPASNHIPANVKVTAIEKWRTYAYRLGISTGGERAQQKAFKSAFEYLNGRSEIAVWEPHVWIARERTRASLSER